MLCKTGTCLPYNKEHFRVVNSIQKKNVITKIIKTRPQVVHVLPTTTNSKRQHAVVQHVMRILNMEEHYCVLFIKSETHMYEKVREYITKFLSEISYHDKERIQFIEFSTGYQSSSSGETREAAKIIFADICKLCFPIYSNFLIRLSDDRRESRVKKDQNERDVFAKYRNEMFKKKGPVIGGCIPWFNWTRNIKCNPNKSQFECCVQTLFMTPKTFIHIMEVCYNDPRNLSAFASPLAQDYAFMECLMRNGIKIEQTSKFGRYSYNCPSISRKKNVTKAYANEQIIAFALMMKLFLNVQPIKKNGRNYFIMHFNNGYSHEIYKDKGFEVHWEAFQNWFKGGSLSTPTNLITDFKSLAHSQSPTCVIDLTIPSSPLALSHGKPGMVIDLTKPTSPSHGKRKRMCLNHNESSQKISRTN